MANGIGHNSDAVHSLGTDMGAGISTLAPCSLGFNPKGKADSYKPCRKQSEIQDQIGFAGLQQSKQSHKIMSSDWLSLLDCVCPIKDLTELNSGYTSILRDFKIIEDDLYLLLKTDSDKNPFVVRVPLTEKKKTLTLEQNGTVYHLRRHSRIYKPVVRDIMYLFSTDISGLDDQIRDKTRSHFEFLYYKAPSKFSWPSWMTNCANTSTTTVQNTDKSRFDQVIHNENPVVLQADIHAALQGVVQIPIRLPSDDQPLSPDESTQLVKSLQSISKNFWGVIANQDFFNQLNVEIISDDLFDSMIDESLVGVNYWPAKIVIRRSLITRGEIKYLRSLFIHEFGHSLFPKPRMHLNGATYRKTKRKLKRWKDPYFSAVSLYAMTSPWEFICENVTAYFTDDSQDIAPIDPHFGSMTRTELREKHPDLYLAIQLFFAPDSGFYGTHSVFSRKTKYTQPSYY